MTNRRNFIRSTALGAAALTVTPASAILKNHEAGKMSIGVAREIITPKLGGLFMGYGSDKPSTAIHDDLAVTALSMTYEGNSVLLMSVNVCLIGNNLCEKLRLLCGESAGIPASQVILAATHTHSGPDTTDGGDTDYCNEILIPKCQAAAKAAFKEMKPATVGVATTESKVGINRRKLLPNDKVILGQNPWAPYDSEMTVISFQSENQKPVANIIHCAAHPTASGINTEVTRDWPGVMIDRLEKESGAITLFFNGMQGDVAPRMANGGSTGDIHHAMEVGAVAGIDAVRAYKNIRLYREEKMQIATGEVKIPHAPLIPLEEARQQLAKEEAGKPHRWSEDNKRILKSILQSYEKGETGISYFTYNQTLINIGSIVLIPIPFEASSEISFRFRAYSKYGHTLALGCTNGSNWYLPTQDQIPRGGYEVERFLWSGPRLANNADMHLINENLRLIENFTR